jgi:hypothetical protein
MSWQPEHEREASADRASGHTADPNAFEDFVSRMIDKGASPDNARIAAAAHFSDEALRVGPGALLPGPSARRWQEVMFASLGGFLAVLVSVLFTAPAFHPSESADQSKGWSVIFFATFFPCLAAMFASSIAMALKSSKEIRSGYTTLRWLDPDIAEVRDSRGRPIPADDKRLLKSAKNIHTFGVIGTACVVLSPVFWILSLIIR